MSTTTLCDLFFVAAGLDKSRCLLHKRDGEWQPVSTAELVTQVQQLAKALGELGVGRGDRVALMAENGPHWPIVDFATLCTGAVLVPIYPTLLPEQAAYIVKDCGAKLVLAEGPERLHGLLGQRENLPTVEQFVLIEPGAAEGDGYTTLDAVLSRGEGADPEAFEKRAREVQPDDLATFIYTSGTTGSPKGVMLTHGNITSNVVDSAPLIGADSSWTALSFLPLSHSFERTVDYVYFLEGVTIAYAESIALVGQNMMEVKPQMFVSVPRVYEKVLAKVHDGVAAGSPLKQKIFHWAVGVGRKALPWRLKEQGAPGLLGLKLKIADALVFSKIQARLGGQFERAVSGGAPLSRDVAEFFWGAGIPVYEGYGLSETSPVLTVNSPGKAKLGTVGMAIPSVTLMIAEDGEILAKGPNIMRGYHNLPDATKETIDDEGWFHTGDIGEIDAHGFLAITDRKKELIVNAYGKNVAPAPVEGALRGSRFIGQAVVIGDRRKFLSGLLVPDFAALESWAASHGVTATDNESLIADEKIRTLIGEEVERINKNLAKYERVLAWDLLPAEWTEETGELTPTQKIKRRVINKKFESVIEGIYSAAEGKA